MPTTLRFLGQIVFLRHGQTEYTEVYPDLTEQGKLTIRKSAERIQTLCRESQNIQIVSSPLPRGLGTASIVAKTIGFQGSIRRDVGLQAVVVRDKERGMKIFEEQIAANGIRGLCMSYGTDPRYEDPEIFEPRSEVKRRFFRYFARLLRMMMANTGFSMFVINASHYETLYHLVERLYNLDYEKDEPLSHGELILFSVFDIGIQNVVEFEVTFRNETLRRKHFNYSKEVFL